MRTDEEVNTIFAKYMGLEKCTCGDVYIGAEPHVENHFTKSIDALVPVWVKMYASRITTSYNDNETVFIMLREIMDKCKWMLIQTRDDGPSNLTYAQVMAHVTCDELENLKDWKSGL